MKSKYINKFKKEIKIDPNDVEIFNYREKYYHHSYVKWLENKLRESEYRSYYLLCEMLGDPTNCIPKKYRDKFDKQYNNYDNYEI